MQGQLGWASLCLQYEEHRPAEGHQVDPQHAQLEGDELLVDELGHRPQLQAQRSSMDGCLAGAVNLGGGGSSALSAGAAGIAWQVHCRGASPS